MVIFEYLMSFIKDYFHFNKRQERGVFVLSIIIIIVILLNHYAPFFYQRNPESLNENNIYFKQLSLIAYKEIQEKRALKESYKNKKEEPVELNIDQKFDPNTIPLEELLKMGVPKYVAENINKYRSKGGKFRVAQDIEKIYGMNEHLSDQMKPWIICPKPKMKVHQDSAEKKVKSLMNKEAYPREIIRLGINASDSLDLLQVSGIGPFYAGAIVKYRNQLGGYIRLEQLMELYKMDSLKYNNMIKSLFLDSISPNQIALNGADFKTLLRHPYIDYETTKYLINKRKRLGKYSALYQIKDDTQMPPNQYEKILPYIKLD